MMRLIDVCKELDLLAPLALAEEWDNVGLLVGDPEAQIGRAMTCLTVTETTLIEAKERPVELLIAHHPLPFRPLQRITTESPAGRRLLEAIRAGIAIYSAHTAWDNAPAGINRSLARILDLRDPRPITPARHPGLAERGLGTGIVGRFETASSVDQIVERLADGLGSIQPRTTHSGSRRVHSLGIVCGSGGSLLPAVAAQGCDAMLTGEATYHQCLEAESRGVALIQIGHFASEFFGMHSLATLLGQSLKELDVRAACREHSVF